MKLNKVIAEKFLKLKNGEILSYSEFQGNQRKLIETLENDKVLHSEGKIKKKIICQNGIYFENYLKNKGFINDTLENFIIFIGNSESERSDAIKFAGDDKFKNVTVLKGFLLNCYDEIYGKIRENKITIKPVNGSYIFIHDYQNFTIEDDITIVLVENAEILKRIEKLKYLFIGIKPLFICRFLNSNVIVEWLNSINNPYLHFGDFDLKGIHIYISEFRNKIDNLTRCIFLYPVE